VSQRRRRWDRDFKLRAIARMEASPSIQGLAEELGVRREMLHKWRRAYEDGGAEALHAIGRPNGRQTVRAEPPSSEPLSDLEAAQRRIGELERTIGQQQLDLDFFRAALRHVREQRQPTGAPGETASTR